MKSIEEANAVISEFTKLFKYVLLSSRLKKKQNRLERVLHLVSLNTFARHLFADSSF